jgi:hypothetical protein
VIVTATLTISMSDLKTGVRDAACAPTRGIAAAAIVNNTPRAGLGIWCLALGIWCLTSSSASESPGPPRPVSVQIECHELDQPRVRAGRPPAFASLSTTSFDVNTSRAATLSVARVTVGGGPVWPVRSPSSLPLGPPPTLSILPS